VGELTDAEFWLLLSLDAESAVWELLMPITRIEGRQRRQIRPSLEIPEAAEALASLAARGFVEVRVRPEGVDDWDEWPHREYVLYAKVPGEDGFLQIAGWNPTSNPESDNLRRGARPPAAPPAPGPG